MEIDDLYHIKLVLKKLHKEYREKEFNDYHLEIKKRIGYLYADTEALQKLIENGELNYLKNRKMFEGQ